MRKILPIILTLGGALALYYLSRGRAAQKLKIYFKDIIPKIEKGEFLPVLYARFNVINGTNTGLSINSITGDVTINGEAVAAVSMLDKFTVAPNSTSVLSVKIAASPLGAGAVLFRIITKKQAVNAGFEGTVNSGGILIPISQSVKLF
jgi:LEA14-like dessication related protein